MFAYWWTITFTISAGANTDCVMEAKCAWRISIWKLMHSTSKCPWQLGTHFRGLSLFECFRARYLIHFIAWYCIVLNLTPAIFIIFTTSVAAHNKSQKKLPVIFYIHGGGFAEGSGNDFFFGPDFLLEQGIIVVTINYRFDWKITIWCVLLWIFGFYYGNLRMFCSQIGNIWFYVTQYKASFG